MRESPLQIYVQLQVSSLLSSLTFQEMPATQVHLVTQTTVHNYNYNWECHTTITLVYTTTYCIWNLIIYHYTRTTVYYTYIVLCLQVQYNVCIS